jgi:hypothetical protein
LLLCLFDLGGPRCDGDSNFLCIGVSPAVRAICAWLGLEIGRVHQFSRHIPTGPCHGVVDTVIYSNMHAKEEEGILLS